MKRRTLFLLAGAAGSGLIVGSPAAEPLPREEEADVVVVGTGAAGLSAALAAVSEGARRVVVLEKAPLAGGHTIISSGSVAAEKSPEGIAGLTNEILETGEGRADPQLARSLAEGSWGAIERLSALGITWITTPFRAVGSPSARSWNSGSPQSGYDYVQVMMAALRKTSAAVRFLTRGEGLLLSGDGRSVEGLYARTQTGDSVLIRSKAVVLATGGFTASKTLRRRFAPDLPPELETTASAGGELLDGAEGDGILMAEKAGAKLVDMDALQMLPLAGGRLLDYVGGEVWLNDSGERFVSEGAGFREIERAISNQPSKSMWVISDARSPKGATLGLKLMDGTVREAETLHEAARGMGVPYTALEETIARYNRSVRKHWDDDFGIPMRGLPVETPPFFYGREHFALHYSCGGIAITPRAEVLRPDGLVIAGLYAAGETTGGVHGAARVGGCGLTDAFVFGDIAGREAARFIGARGPV
ncbi:FAD-dependent oxidoreductase [uncultured Sutterella sp.]|uniref:FAD-dependent oxidoreductase n=1 Tax=uncultured Sutterella sp. TaxID=286133 RepID=UPI00262AEA08|nr:FAD-dependent oxidoreductase [uncultured Sutterella sp.]